MMRDRMIETRQFRSLAAVVFFFGAGAGCESDFHPLATRLGHFGSVGTCLSDIPVCGAPANPTVGWGFALCDALGRWRRQERAGIESRVNVQGRFAGA